MRCKNRTMRIDAHHTFDTHGIHTPPRLWPILERNRFEGTVFVQGDPSAVATDGALALAAKFDFIKGVVAWADLLSPNLGRHLDGLQTGSKLKGLCLQLTPELDAHMLLEPARRGLTVDMVLKPEQLGMIQPLMDRVPELTLIICHLGSPTIGGGGFEHWAWNLEQAAKCPNVALKISGLPALNRPQAWNAVDFRPYVQHAIICFGPDRLMFGSGWPDCLPGGTWKESLAAFTQTIGAHSIDFREKLLGATAVRLYKLLT